MGQRQPRHGLDRMAHLGLRRAQELVPHRRVEEQVAHLDRRADRAADRRDRLRRRRRRLPAPRRSSASAVAAADHQPADFGDRCQRFAAEAERARPRTSRRPSESCSWHGSPRPAAARRPRCRSRCRPRGSFRCRPSRSSHRSASRRRRPSSPAAPSRTLAGRSITSPAAILFTTLGGSCWMVGMSSGDSDSRKVLTQRRIANKHKCHEGHK